MNKISEDETDEVAIPAGFTGSSGLVPEAKGRIHSLLLRSSLHRSLKAALQLLCVQPPNTYMDWLES